MEYCLGNGLELFSWSKVLAVCQDSSVFQMRQLPLSITQGQFQGQSLHGIL